MIEETPGDRLRKARIERGYDSATEAAKSMGWAVPTYLGHENGSRGLRSQTASKYARGFGVSPAWLLMGSSEKTIMPNQLHRVVMIPIVGSAAVGVWRDTDSLQFTAEQREKFEQVFLPKGEGLTRLAVDPFVLKVEQTDIEYLPEGCFACCARNQLPTKLPEDFCVIRRRQNGKFELSIALLSSPVPSDGDVAGYVFGKYEPF